MTTIRVKGWKADQIDSEARNYNTFCDVVYNEERGFSYYRQMDDSAIYFVDELIKETEKAICVRLRSGSVDGSTKGWKTWIPKSAVIAQTTPTPSPAVYPGRKKEVMIIYQKFRCHYCNAFRKTHDGKWESIGEDAVYDFLRTAKTRDVTIMVDGKVPFLSATK